ncbi:MAG: riboflavin biosynthesis protein RibF [Bacteroides sp.]|nr:riboflavin biosynthesis protein RibF [Bacteroides sp.]
MTEPSDIQSPAPNGESRRAATVGTFDGLHRGHMLVLDTLRREGAARGLRTMAVTFAGHPLKTIAPSRAPGLLMDPAEKLRCLRLHADEVMTVDFTPHMASMTAGEWLTRLRDDYGVRMLVLGYDNTFGSDGRTMTHGDYVGLASGLGIEAVLPPQLPGCSSSAARRAVGAGEMEEAAGILGRPYSITGTVVAGDRLGRAIGVPTANIDPPSERVLPPYGAYVTRVTMPDGTRRLGLTNIGMRPSVSLPTPTLRMETFIPDFEGDLYGSRLTLEFLSHLRPERKFASLDELRLQIMQDTDNARTIYNNNISHENNQL